MVPKSYCLASMARLDISGSLRPLRPAVAGARLAVPVVSGQVRWASAKKKAQEKAAKEKRLRERMKLSKKKDKLATKTFKKANNPDPKKAPQFSMCDAIRYLRAFSAGRYPVDNIYEVAIRIHTLKQGMPRPVSGTLLLPHPLASKIRTAVVCREGSEVARQALEAGAVAVGLDSLFDRFRGEGEKLDVQRVLVHTDSEAEFERAQLGRVLGPQGLMPSRKRGTVTANIGKELASQARIYSEKKDGVIRMPVGHMAYTPKMLAANMGALMDHVKASAEKVGGKVETKKIMEVVFSSTRGPGFSLNGKYIPSARDISDKDLAGPL